MPGSVPDAEDAVQHALLRAWRGLAGFEGRSTVRSWLLRDPLTRRWRHAGTEASGQLAVGCCLYSDDTGRYDPAVIDVLTRAGGKMAAVTAFVLLDERDPPAVFASFGLPEQAG